MSAHTRVVISFLWTFIGLNMAFADLLSLYTPGTVPQLLEGTIEGIQLSDQLMLIGAIFLQVALIMIVATLLLASKWCRYLNTLAVGITAVFVIAGGSLKPHYIFFATFEVFAMIVLLFFVWGRGRDRSLS